MTPPVHPCRKCGVPPRLYSEVPEGESRRWYYAECRVRACRNVECGVTPAGTLATWNATQQPEAGVAELFAEVRHVG